MKTIKKRLKIGLIIFLSLIIMAAGIFLLYVSDYSRADSGVSEAMAANSKLEDEGEYIVLNPSEYSGIGLVFYPGGKVEYTAYIPLLELLQQKGITCVLFKMPFNLAVFDVNAADKVLNSHIGVTDWYIGGHSLGGAMASSYAASHMDRIKGLILLGAYIYGDIDPASALTVYGSEDLVLDRTKITYNTNVVVIQGGNHAQFGNYGKQKGDGTATITSDEQQDLTVAAIMDFIHAAE
ncbi:MAG: alpha/beta fold hydrolase [Saccharofermentanales bacterium]